MTGEMTSRRPDPAERPSSNRPRPPRPSDGRGGSGARPQRAAQSSQAGRGASRPELDRGRNASNRGAKPPRDAQNPRVSQRPGPGRPTSGKDARPEGRPHVPLAFGYGALSAIGVVIALMVPVFAAWTIDSQSSSSWNDTLGVTIDLWALAHRGHVNVDGTSVVFSPLVLTFLCVLAARFGARAAFPDERLHARDLRLILLAFIGGYVAAAQVLAVVASLGASHISWWSLLLGPFVVAAAGVAWTAWHEREHSPELKALDDLVLDATPLLLQRSIRSGLRGLRWLALASLVLVVALVAWHGGRVWTVHQQLNPGLVGGILLVAAQLLALPNLMALGAGWFTGSSVHVGAVSIGHGAMTPGTLPMIPVLGALPDGVGPWAWIFLLVPIAVGGWIGWDAVGALTRLSSLRAKCTVALCAAALATLVMWLVWWFATARVSTGLLDYVGPGWNAWVLLPVLFVTPAVAVAGVRHWMLNHTH